MAATPAIPAPGVSARRPDVPTVVAIAAVAGALCVFLHEFAGHGGFCVLTGGAMQRVTSFDFTCSVENRWMEAGGTLVNAALGLLAWLLLGRVRQPHWRFFLWAFMTLNWLEAAGYFLYSGVANFGDWANVLQGAPRAGLWRVVMVLGGAALYYAVMRVMMRELRPFLPGGAAARRALARDYLLASYFAFGGLETAAGFFSPLGWRLVLAAAVAGSFGGAAGLAWGWTFVHRPGPPGPFPPLPRCWGWISAGVAVGAVYIGVLGPGLRLN